VRTISFIFKYSVISFLSWCFFDPIMETNETILAYVGFTVIELPLTVLFSLVCGFIVFDILKRRIWWQIGYFIARKKYNNGCHKFVHYKGKDCSCFNPHNRHRGSFAYYGPLVLSRWFVRKFICEEF